MEPRLVIKTHAGVSKPGLFSILITRCSYPDKNSYPEIVSRRLYRLYERNDRNFNKLAAKFVVIMAKRFGFLNENMTWAWRGHVINSVIRYSNKAETEDIGTFLELTMLEKIVYLRYYLEADGSLMLQLASLIRDYGEISKNELSNTIHLLFREIYEGYIDLSRGFKERVELKERLKKIPKEKRYDQKTVIHKIKPHIYSLIDLGLLLKEEVENGDEIYQSVVYNRLSAMTLLLQELVDFRTMEKKFDNYEYFRIIDKILNLQAASFEASHSNILRKTIATAYSFLKADITRIADIDAIVDWCCAKMLVEDKIIVNAKLIRDFIEHTRKEKPRSVRYHVDYRGRRSYVILEDGWEDLID